MHRAVLLKVLLRGLAPGPLSMVCALLLQGCGLLPAQSSEDVDARQAAGHGRPAVRHAFSVEVEAPGAVRDMLRTHLDILRYRQFEELGVSEVSRLMVAAEANARELLATQGYFTPTLTLTLEETPGDPESPRRVRIQADPGPATRVEAVRIGFDGPVAQESAAEVQRRAIRAEWKLPTGQVFTQAAWDEAKAAGLRSLQARRYPTARIADSRASVDADAHEAQLGVTYDSGPAYRFGPLMVHGNARYGPEGARRIARLPVGADYDQQTLLDAQQRLAGSGLYDAVFLTLDTEGASLPFAPVIAQVREAPLQKLVTGIGFTSDSGPRLSLDHTHNRMPLPEWRAVSRLSYDRNNQFASTEWSALPGETGWHWFTSGLLQRENNAGSYTVNSARLRAGQNKSSSRIDRSLWLQYEYARNQGVDPPPSAAALSLNWGWTGRYFDNNALPMRGQGFALEMGAGYTLIGPRLPYLRWDARWLGMIPLGRGDGPVTAARRSRLALRAEAGAVVAQDEAQIPSTQLFLTGGDTTVRGYSYRQIGAVNALGQIAAGRYLGVVSIEWQQPLVWDGKLSDWEGVLFADAGAVADQLRQLRPQLGVGAGARWRSPVGPVQIDLAYGVEVKAFRLHFRLGFTF